MNWLAHWFFRCLVIGSVILGASGCKSTDDDLVERPWNAPKSWETGLPAGMMEGR